MTKRKRPARKKPAKHVVPAGQLRPYEHWTPEKEKRALQLIRETGTVGPACEELGIPRSSFYMHMNKTPEFAAAVAEIRESVLDDLRGSAVKRALAGSETLTIFLLKCLDPKTFRDRPKEDATEVLRLLQKVAGAVQSEVVDPDVQRRIHARLMRITAESFGEDGQLRLTSGAEEQNGDG